MYWIAAAAAGALISAVCIILEIPFAVGILFYALGLTVGMIK